MTTIREIQGIKLVEDGCNFFHLTDGKRSSKKFGTYGSGYYLQLNAEDFVVESKQEIANNIEVIDPETVKPDCKCVNCKCKNNDTT